MFDYEVLCTQPLPELEGGWDSTSWPSPKTKAQVIITAAVGDAAQARLSAIEDHWRAEGMPVDTLAAMIPRDEIVAVVSLNCRPKTREFAEGYGEVVARASAGLLLEVDTTELLIDARGEAPGDGAAIEAGFEAVDERLLDARRQQQAAAQQAWERLAEEDPEAVRAANDWSDVAPDSG